jgi:hypothetical protein
MREQIEWSNIDRNSPIWGGSGCDYFSLEVEVNSYWAKYYADKLNLEEYGDGELLKLKPVKELTDTISIF